VDGVQFPLLGNSIILAVVILIHVFLAFFAVGGLALSVAAEYWGTKKKDPDFLRLARGISGFLSDMMKINGTLGVAIVVLTVGLWSPFGAFLYSVHFWAFLAEGACFLLLMVTAIAYHHSWDSASRGRHIFYGISAAFFALLTGFFINGIWAFMMVPGKWMQTQSRFDAFFTPILPESTLHLLLPCFINAALLVFLWTYWKSARTTGAEQAYFHKMNAFAGKIGAALLLLQPLSGLSFLFKLKSATQNLPAPNPWQQLADGMAHRFLIVMITLAALAAVCSIAYWLLGHEKGRRALVVAALAMFVAFFMGAYTRERARKPYLVWNTMGMSQQLEKAAPPAATSAATSVGTAASTSAPAATLTAVAAIDGQQVYKKSGCQSCHTYQGDGGSFGPHLDNVKSKYDRAKIISFLRQPPTRSMRPFTGTEEELNALADFLLK
jgi:cytochrome bd-type quinol oxidase subunit 1